MVRQSELERYKKLLGNGRKIGFMATLAMIHRVLVTLSFA